MTNWKTTTAGVLTILGAVAHAGLQYLNKQPIDYAVLWSGIIAGVGLIKAADAAPAAPHK